MSERAPTHAQQVERMRRKRMHRIEPTHRKLYRTARWRRFRTSVLQDRPICETDGCNALATDVHHVRMLARHPEDLCDDEQVQCLCHACHSRETNRERAT